MVAAVVWPWLLLPTCRQTHHPGPQATDKAAAAAACSPLTAWGCEHQGRNAWHMSAVAFTIACGRGLSGVGHKNSRSAPAVATKHIHQQVYVELLQHKNASFIRRWRSIDATR